MSHASITFPRCKGGVKEFLYLSSLNIYYWRCGTLSFVPSFSFVYIIDIAKLRLVMIIILATPFSDMILYKFYMGIYVGSSILAARLKGKYRVVSQSSVHLPNHIFFQVGNKHSSSWDASLCLYLLKGNYKRKSGNESDGKKGVSPAHTCTKPNLSPKQCQHILSLEHLLLFLLLIFITEYKAKLGTWTSNINTSMKSFVWMVTHLGTLH